MVSNSVEHPRQSELKKEVSMSRKTFFVDYVAKLDDSVVFSLYDLILLI